MIKILLVLLLVIVSSSAYALDIKGRISGYVPINTAVTLYTVNCGEEGIVDTAYTVKKGFFVFKDVVGGLYMVKPDNACGDGCPFLGVRSIKFLAI